MKETFVAVKAQSIGLPLLGEVMQWLLLELEDESLCDECDNDILSMAWRDVGDAMRDAVKAYPLEQAAIEAASGLTAGASG